MSASLQWSTYFQNPEYLERTRMFLITPEFRPLVRRWCEVRDGARVLDVGCGTGYFSRLLAEGPEDVTVVGVDLEEPFIAYARREAQRAGQSCMSFMVANGCELPFEDDSFDVVVSHTFLTSVDDPVRAMDEMKRVACPGGLIASITAMSFMPSAFSQGYYPPECTWVVEFRALDQRVQSAYLAIDSLDSRVPGIEPVQAPRFFVERGLEQVSAYPLGKLFSLSNAAVSQEERLRWIDLYETSELKKLEAFCGLDEFRRYVNKTMVQRYRELLGLRCAWLREHLVDNTAWEWQGGANVLVCGRVST